MREALFRTKTGKILASIVCCWTLSGCASGPDGSVMSRGEAQKLSDAFMGDLVADRVDDALG